MDDLMLINGGQELTTDAAEALIAAEKEAAHAEAVAKQLKAKRDALRGELYRAMTLVGVKKISNPDITITYVEPSRRETFDRNRMLADNPDLAEIMAEYISYAPVAGGVRVKLHGAV